MSDLDLFLAIERAALLLGCLRNYRDAGRQEVDLDGALRLESEVSGMLMPIRDELRKRWGEDSTDRLRAVTGQACPLPVPRAGVMDKS